ncbi:hypothetical protein DC522_00030 [Microvirga sp. KLBC 81]|uniref:hypothetical protein n=1 Tax=Microvirga sp. KLBC 81 TaxID=1862707 RepID=UPI000D506AA9|nr:hypothetical protein [Microvirga sp. KLBC 81]PVE26198.1 hypothetical protein DC522_00030 [Microvirga sp. KLBC 81]
MSDWINFDQWHDCAQMERPGFVFEVKNKEGQSLLTTCTVPLQLPFDWKSPPACFRLIEAPEPRRSNPIPKPQI